MPPLPIDCMILNALDRGQVQHISRKPIKDFKPYVIRPPPSLYPFPH